MRNVGAFALLLFCLRAASADNLYLSGSIGKSPILVTLEEKDGKLSGWYLYLNQGKQIRLEGQIEQNGAFHLTEFISGNRSTGIFDGDKNRGIWQGTWRKPNETTKIPFSFQESSGKASDLNGQIRCSSVKKDKQSDYRERYSLRLSVSNGTAKELDLDRVETSKFGDEQSCSIGLGDLTQIPSAVGISLRGRDDGASHGEDTSRCSILIIGAGDYLYVQMGDSSDGNNDCRGSASAMYCSPRAFWTDIIVNRKTQVCKSVE